MPATLSEQIFIDPDSASEEPKDQLTVFYRHSVAIVSSETITVPYLFVTLVVWAAWPWQRAR